MFVRFKGVVVGVVNYVRYWTRNQILKLVVWVPFGMREVLAVRIRHYWTTVVYWYNVSWVVLLDVNKSEQVFYDLNNWLIIEMVKNLLRICFLRHPQKPILENNLNILYRIDKKGRFSSLKLNLGKSSLNLILDAFLFRCKAFLKITFFKFIIFFFIVRFLKNLISIDSLLAGFRQLFPESGRVHWLF